MHGANVSAIRVQRDGDPSILDERRGRGRARADEPAQDAPSPPTDDELV